MRFSALQLVTISVITTHILTFIPCYFAPLQAKPTKTPIAVRTIRQSAPSIQKTVNTSPAKKPVIKASTAPQKVAVKPLPPKPVKKKETKSIPSKQQPLKKVANQPVNPKPSQLDVPILSVSPQNHESKEADKTDNTIDQLLLELQNLIELPKKGEVKVQLTIGKNGKIEAVLILDDEDDEMKAYLLGKLLNTQLLLSENLQKELEVTVLFKGF